jgi:preprotein translocase subunit SecD
MIELTFNSDWADIFGELSKRLVNQQMAIFVGGELLTAPNINEPILSWKAVITGTYTPAEANKLANDINTWVVPAPIYLTSEKSIDSKLWASSLDKLIFAGLAWFLLIFIFLIYTYRVSGIMASIALILYVLIILTIVKFLWITLTLASIAGLILSIWMAIDANILIFERIQDELNAWEKIAKASKTGFKKSWSAIWDSNVTGLIVALILFIFGINLIKGFWLMLAIWILVSLFSVMWISRILVFVVAEKSKNEKSFIWK